MKFTEFKYHLSVSMLALVIGLGMPVLAQAKNAESSVESADSNSDENAEAVNSGDTGTDADYEAESKDEQKVEGYKHYYIDQNGHATAVLSSDAPPDAENAAMGITPVQNQNSVVSRKTDGDQPGRKLKHPAGNSNVAGTDDSSKPDKPSSTVRHTANSDSAKSVSDSDHKTQVKLAHLKLFRHRIKRTEAEKMADGQDAASGQGQ